MSSSIVRPEKKIFVEDGEIRAAMVVLAVIFCAVLGLFIHLEMTGALKVRDTAVEFAMTQLNNCNEAQSALGRPIKKISGSFLEPDVAPEGGYKGSSNHHRIIKVAGPKAQGQFEFNVETNHGEFYLTLGRLQAGGKTIDVKSCKTDVQ